MDSEPQPAGSDTDLRRQAGPHAFVPDLNAPSLTSDDHHHLARVLRLRDGDPMTLSDGQGRWCTARFAECPEPTGPVVDVPSIGDSTTLAFALTKAGKPELVVQKATEIGVDHIVIFHGEHSVPRWDDNKRTKGQGRLERVAYEAAMQSRQVRLPTVQIVGGLGELLEGLGGARSGAQPLGVARADFGGAPIGPATSAVIIGPEGGWSERECQLVPETVDLGSTVLRAETAAVIAAANLVATRDLRSTG